MKTVERNLDFQGLTRFQTPLWDDCVILLSFARLSLAADGGFGRYQIIIDRHPFGKDPPVAETVQIPLNQSFARHLRLAMLFEGPNGDLRAGFVNASQKKNYILRVGETEEDLELMSVDLSSSEAMLRKGHEVALFKLGSTQSSPSVESSTSSRQSSYSERRRALLKQIGERRKKAE